MNLLLVSAAISATALGADEVSRLNPALQKYVEARAAEFGQIPKDRQERLRQVTLYIRERVKSGQPALLTFICTHNSRRSHLAQIWAQAAAVYYGTSGVETFSGGTEATAFNPRAVRALQRAGFEIANSQPPAADNPRYQVRIGESGAPLECFSKVYDQVPNPNKDFCAIMTCTQADQSCPLVAGASVRLSVPYEDPKAFDETPQETESYDERCRQIAREMLYVFSKL